MTTGFLYDPRYLEHETPGLPETPQRLLYLHSHLESTGLLQRLTAIAPRKAELDVVRLVHPDSYLRRIRKAILCGDRFIDHPDVVVGKKSWETALLAVGGVLAMCDAVMARRVDNGFCALRPPGHHAEAHQAMGFCLLNNVAIGARYLQSVHGLQNIAIIDWDVHHGNGTQNIFEEDPSVLFISLHEHPSHLYPGTGYAWEKGRGPGEGSTLNIPLYPEADDADYQMAFNHWVLPALRKFQPQAILISAGFDAHADDPLGHLRLTSVGYAWMTRQLRHIAQTYAQGRLISVLEGGYNPKSLAWSVQTHLETLAES